MKYEELKAQDDWYRSFPDWGDDDELILKNIKARLKANASRHFFKMLTDIDESIQTTSKDLVESLLKAGFPKEKLFVDNQELFFSTAERDFLRGTFSHERLWANNCVDLKMAKTTH